MEQIVSKLTYGLERGLITQEIFDKDLTKSKEAIDEQITRRDNILNSHELYEKVIADLENRKRLNIDTLTALGIDVKYTNFKTKNKKVKGI